MPTYRAQVVIPMFTNLPSDVVTNTLHFDPLTPLGFQETADLVQPHLTSFYQTCYGSVTGGMASYMSPSTATVNWYDLGEPTPRVPYTLPLGATITTGVTQLPTEVSVVLSFQGPRVAGMPQARRRGRIFLGGITHAWFDNSSASAFPKLTGSKSAVLAVACEALRDGVLSDGVRWSVWSQTDQASALVDNGWIDNGPDTQRRRSVESSLRNVWS